MMRCSAFKLQQCNRFADVKFGFEFQRSRAMHNSKCACICTNNTHLYCIHCIASGALRLRAKRRTYKIACHLQSVWISLHNKPDSFYSVLHYFYFHFSLPPSLSHPSPVRFFVSVVLNCILLPLLFFRWLCPSSPYRYRCIFSFFVLFSLPLSCIITQCHDNESVSDNCSHYFSFFVIATTCCIHLHSLWPFHFARLCSNLH